MERADVIRLVMIIAESYPTFDDSDENIDRHAKYLRDFPLDTAIQNVEQHIMTNKFPPTIAEIRGRLGEQIERERMKAVTSDYFAERESAAREACPPPTGWKEALIANLRSIEH
ncbi:replicative helicase loader/inhibitor [Paenibacillus massiliensis]|uniref:replicative helicase loader/inhibitor n=1 Tax=Paenibacillus massiliensis TaxID=225917 RepID=UPI0003FF9BF3|nr:replicative helicase loader/inhibitor [Paenibacillus massiliensis]